MQVRRGLSRVETIIVLVIIVVVIAMALPTIVRQRENARQLVCKANLVRVGKGMEMYRTADPAATYPPGARFNERLNAPGTSWWFEIMPFLDLQPIAAQWKPGPAGGDFGNGSNENIRLADGFRNPIFFCPSSPLPAMNDPLRHVSQANRDALGRPSEGIAVPMYAAVAGSAPDAKGINLARFASSPIHRNTADGRYGILSQSGIMTVNYRVADAAVRDPKGQTLLVVEQSDYLRVGDPESPDLYDLRSSWPRGVFAGSDGNYRQLTPLSDDVNTTGDARVWGVTTIRYGVNAGDLLGKLGIVVDPAQPRPTKDGEPAPPPSPYPPEGYGPGHNHGIRSAHPNGANVLMADVTVRFLNQAIDRDILLRLATRDDGAELGDNFHDDDTNP